MNYLKKLLPVASLLVLILFFHSYSQPPPQSCNWGADGYVVDINGNGIQGATVEVTARYCAIGSLFPGINWTFCPAISATGETVEDGYFYISIDPEFGMELVCRIAHVIGCPPFAQVYPWIYEWQYSFEFEPPPYGFVNWPESGPIFGDPEYYIPDPDLDQDGLDDDFEMDLANRFAPILHKHAWDKQEDLADADIWVDDYGHIDILGGPASLATSTNPLHRWCEDHWGTWGWPLTFFEYEYRLDFEDDHMYSGALPNIRPLYYHVYASGDATYVQYWYFLGYNDLRYHNQTIQNTYHEGDWEHVEIKLINGVPDKMNFYQHLGGYTRNPEDCWWSSTNAYTYNGIQQGYDSNHEHLHVWISANGHASFNRYDLVYHMHANTILYPGLDENYYDNVDYGSACPLYFQYDYLEKMGEVDVEYGVEEHGMFFISHYAPKGNSKDWLAFTGWFGGQYYSTNVYITVLGTPPPVSPGGNPFYYWFPVDYDEFGHSEHIEHGFPNIILFWQVGFFDWAADPVWGDYGSSKFIRLDSYKPGGVTITWEPCQTGNTSHYNIYRLVTTSYPRIQDFECIAAVNAPDTLFADNSISVPGYDANSRLLYYLTVVDNTGIESEPSNMLMPKIPSAPQNIQATAPEPDLHPVISWSPNPEFNIAGYNVYKKLILPDSTIIPFTKQNDELITDTTWTDTTFIAFHGGAETAYYYVTAVNEDNGESTPSNEVSGGGRTPAGAGETFGETAAMLDDFTSIVISPNPFNNQAVIKFATSTFGKVNVSVYNLLGQKVTELYDGMAAANKVYTLTLDGSGLTSGIYICRFNSPEKVENRKLVLLK